MQFEDWFYEIEGFGIRAERFYDDLAAFHADKVGDQTIVGWLKAAYAMGREHENIGWVESHWDDGK